MRAKELNKIIKQHLGDVKTVLKCEFDKYDAINIDLPDGGSISVGIEPKTKRCNFSFLFFNIWNSEIRVTGQNEYNGKLNYFGNESKEKLIELLTELKEKLK